MRFGHNPLDPNQQNDYDRRQPNDRDRGGGMQDRRMKKFEQRDHKPRNPYIVQDGQVKPKSFTQDDLRAEFKLPPKY